MANRNAPRNPVPDVDPNIAAIAGDVANLTAAVQALNQAVQATNNNVANMIANWPGANATAPVFALSPGTTAVDDLIDYSTKHGAQLYKTGCSSLPTSFGMNAAGVLLFQREMLDRVKAMGWDSAAQGIITFANADGDLINVITDFGRISHASILAGADRFINGAQRNQRAAQNNHMMGHSITSTILADKRSQLLAYKSRYETSPNGSNEKIIVAASYWKTIMELTSLDCTATNSALRNDLRNVGQFCINSNGDIDAIINHVTMKYTQLKSRGEDMPDLPEILLAAFKDNVDDDNFSKYWDKKHSDFWDGEPVMANVTVEQILIWAKTKFDLLVSQKKWGAKSKEMEDIIALKAHVEQLEESKLKLSRQLAQKQKGISSKDSDGKAAAKLGKPGTPKTKNKKNLSDKKKQKADEAWMKVPPKDGEPTMKMYRNKKWHWCIHHMAWTMHTSEECKLGKERVAAAAAGNSIPSTTMANAATVSADDYNAYAALMGTLAASAAASFQE